MTFLSGVQLLFLGIIGEYVGRVYGEAKGDRPYIVARIVGRRLMEAEYTAAYPVCTVSIGGGGSESKSCSERFGQILAERADDVRILDVGCGAGLFFDASRSSDTSRASNRIALAVEQSGRWRDRIHLGNSTPSRPIKPST